MESNNQRKKYQVLSPDGFTIEFDKWTYPSMKQAKESFSRWAKGYINQGYYSSSRYGRIPLNELENYCQFKTI
jgi:hypothetical protein